MKDVGYWNTPHEDLGFRLTAQPLERPYKAVAHAVEEKGIRRIGLDDRATDVRIYPLLSLLPDIRFDYVRGTALPERIDAGDPEPQAIVEVVPVEAFPGVLADGTPRGRQLIRPQVADDVVIMLYTTR